MSNIQEFSKTPDVSFIDGLTLQQIRDQIVSDYTAAYEAERGVAPEINPGTPERLMLYAFAAHFYQALQYVDRAGKMGLLKYSEGDWLDNLGVLRGVTRRPATPATAPVLFTLSDIRASATGIPGGTRVAAGDVYFRTDEYLEIPAGSQTGTVTVTAIEAGEQGNGVPAGDLNTIVDPVPYVASVTNTEPSRGGAAIESDDSFTLRIYNSPAGYSVAGPMDAYLYHARNAMADIGDVVAYSPDPDEVNIVFVMADGTDPTPTQIAAMEAYLSDGNIRPLTDHVTATAPDATAYNISLTYYINRSDAAQAAAIQAAVSEAVSAYKKWQGKIGRDIEPSKLIQLVMAAGVKRVTVTAPASHLAVEPYNIARVATETVTYGGLEDD